MTRNELKRKFRNGNWISCGKPLRRRALRLINSCIDDLPSNQIDLAAVGRRVALRVGLPPDDLVPEPVVERELIREQDESNTETGWQEVFAIAAIQHAALNSLSAF